VIKKNAFFRVTMKNAVFWDVAPCRSCVNRRFGGTYRVHLQGRLSLQPPAHAGSSLSDFSVFLEFENIFSRLYNAEDSGL
jgi:hypothetical protein